MQFTCLRCGNCCIYVRSIPLTYIDFKIWYNNGKYLPILLTVKEVSELTEELNLDYIYSIITPAHDVYNKYIEVVKRIGIYEIDENCCPFYSINEKCCKIYPYRPLACRLYPFTIDCEIQQHAYSLCEAVKKGFTKPTNEIVSIAKLYGEAIELTYTNKSIMKWIENIRVEVLDLISKKINSNIINELKSIFNTVSRRS